jgi:hypothetical protein
MDKNGNYIPGPAGDNDCPVGSLFSDGICVKVEKKLNDENGLKG